MVYGPVVVFAGVDTVVHAAGLGDVTQLSHSHSAEQFYLGLLRPAVLGAFNVYHAAADAGERSSLTVPFRAAGAECR